MPIVSPRSQTASHKTADQTLTTATPTDLASLAVTLGVGTWDVEAIVPWSGNTVSASAMTLTAATPTNSFHSSHWYAQNSVTGKTEGALATSHTSGTVGTAGTVYQFRHFARIVVTAAGVYKIQGATNGTNQNTIKSGAYITATRV